MTLNTRERWFVLGKKPGTSGDTLKYVCAIPSSEYGASVPETLNLTHGLRDVKVDDVRKRVFADKDVLTGRLKGNPTVIAGEHEIEEGSPVTLVLKTEQSKHEWDNLDNLPELDVKQQSVDVRIIAVGKPSR